ncbi:MAG: phosphocarrier protein Hpr [Nostoc sp. NMS1]|uniref:phosphocarrier protein Hpr n=1 Tax=unclassified Nostoc TaxID=2593658 RepID=UPI0025DD439A|nr:MULTISPECIES: phosphocarrier protein Hpr [unclassified Nostoc]MBN3908312.1 phosphocarrier protein Hpr [Nostoc sp. NMS1]MBN3992450.1 phosphocarrier protein Hpr [Nostoc sp. NMS2]
MKQQEVTITAPNGLYTRPAAQFVKEAKGFSSEITIISNGKNASAKSLFKLQTIGLDQGTVVTISAEGEDEEQAVEHLVKLMAELE